MIVTTLMILLFGGGIYLVCGPLPTIIFISGYILAKRWLRSYHDREGGKLRVNVDSDYRGRRDLDVLNEANNAAEASGLKRARIYREGQAKPKTKK